MAWAAYSIHFITNSWKIINLSLIKYLQSNYRNFFLSWRKIKRIEKENHKIRTKKNTNKKVMDLKAIAESLNTKLSRVNLKVCINRWRVFELWITVQLNSSQWVQEIINAFFFRPLREWICSKATGSKLKIVTIKLNFNSGAGEEKNGKTVSDAIN